MKLICTPLFFLFLPFMTNASQCSGPRTPAELAEQLWGSDSNYHKTRKSRPNVAKALEENKLYPFDAEPDNIQVHTHLLSFKGLEQQSSEFGVTVVLMKRWNDYRLKFNSAKDGGCFPDDQGVGFKSAQIKNLWTPDISIYNLVEEPVVVADSFWIHPNGDVHWHLSYLLTLSCSFNLKQFPIDTQICEMVLGTWKEDASEVILSFMNEEHPITKSDLGENILGSSLEWDVTSLDGSETNYWEDASIRDESVLSFSFTASRIPHYYQDFVIVPVTFMVVLSWTSFFISRSASPARVAMSIICFLTITNFLATQLSSLPRLGGNEIWLLQFMSISMIFTFYCVIEYVFCNYLFRVENRVKEVIRIAKKRKRKKMTIMEANGLSSITQNGSSGISASMSNGNDSYHSSLPTRRASNQSKSVSSQQHSTTMTNMTQSTTRTNVSVKVNKKDMIQVGLCKIDCLLVRQNGEMFFRDEHIEVASRWLYPISYIVVSSILYAMNFG